MTKLLKFLKEWGELWILPIVITMFILYPKLLSNDIYTEASWGPIYIQKILFGILVVFTGNLLSWIIIKLNNNFHKDLTLWQKELLELILFSVLFLGFIISVLSL